MAIADVQRPNRIETLASLRAAIGDVAFSTAFGTLTTGAFIIGFAKSLGANDFTVNLLIALPSLVGAIGIPGAIWGRSFGSYRQVVRPGGLIWRLMYVGLVFLPLLPLPVALRLGLVLLLVPLATAANSLMGSIYNEWMTELVPLDSRGFFFGRRQAISTAVGAVVGLLGGFLLDAFRGAGREPWGFALVFGIGSVCAAVSMGFFDRIRDVPRENPVRQSVLEGLKAIRDPFGDRDFRLVLLYLAATVFSQTMPGGLFTVFALDTLHLGYKVVAGLALSYSVGIVLATRLWSFLADQYGNKPMLALAGSLMALNALPWVFCPPGNPTLSATIMLTSHVVMGAIFCGQGLCQFNLLLATAKPTDRANYIAAGTTVMAVVGGVAPMIGAAFMPAHPGEWTYKTLFLVTAGLRLLTVPLLIPVRESGSTTIRETLSDLSRLTPRSVGAMRRLNRSEDAAGRAAAIQAVAEERAELASDAILAALHDPQPRVRREAARAIARLRDPRAVAALLEGIEAAPEELEEETIDALGDLGDPAALPTLIAALENPRPLLRRSAARALGCIGGERVVEPLERAVREGDTDLRRAALQGLRQSGARSAAPTIGAALDDPHPSVRTAAAEAIAELELRDAAPALRRVLGAQPDEAEAEAAYALGVVGEPKDLPAILQEASEARSAIARRRALLGAARLLGVERETYRLMLLSGMARDTALVERMKPFVKSAAAARLAMIRYGAGEESGALDALTRLRPDLGPLVERPVEEAFLVAVAAVTSGDPGRHGGRRSRL